MDTIVKKVFIDNVEVYEAYCPHDKTMIVRKPVPIREKKDDKTTDTPTSSIADAQNSVSDTKK